MKVYNVHTYRDGGTVLIETNQGNYFIPGRLDNNDLTGRVLKGDYFKGEGIVVVDYNELHELISELSKGFEVYSEIKKIMR